MFSLVRIASTASVTGHDKLAVIAMSLSQVPWYPRAAYGEANTSAEAKLRREPAQ